MYRPCIAPDCPNPGNHYFKIALMRNNGGNAKFARSTQAYLCEAHASGGFELELTATISPVRVLDTSVKARLNEMEGDPVRAIADL